jgi:hypothetical protein
MRLAKLGIAEHDLRIDGIVGTSTIEEIGQQNSISIPR